MLGNMLQHACNERHKPSALYMHRMGRRSIGRVLHLVRSFFWEGFHPRKRFFSTCGLCKHALAS